MSLLGGMKDRLGFGGKPEWADDDAEYYEDDVVYDDDYDDYGDTGVEERRGSTRRSEVISFDSYNPSNFEHVTLSSDRKPRVASYDSLDSSTRSSRGYSSRSSSSSSRDPYASLGSDFLKIKGNPAGRLEIVCPKAYADIEKVANAAKAGKTVILNVVDTKASLAKRILDFSFGVASALNLNVGKAAVISKSSEPLSEEDREYLVSQDVLKIEDDNAR